MLCTPFTKKRTHSLGLIYLQKMLCWKVWVCGRWEYRDDYEVQWFGREGGGSEVCLHARVL